MARSPAENEVPGGVVSGINGYDGNPTFTLANVPTDPLRVKLYVAGLRQDLNVNFTLTGNTITFLAGFVPLTGDSILADYPY